MINSLYPRFREWSAKGSVYLIGDLHFDDSDCKLMDQNWPSPEEQVKIINSICHKNDSLIVLGDVGDEKYIKYLKAGHKVLICGNHDRGASNYKDCFDEVYEGPLFISEKILLSHECIPGDNWLNIHGHHHNGEKFQNCINLASNVCGWTPISLKSVIKSGKLKYIQSIHRTAINNATERKSKKSI